MLTDIWLVCIGCGAGLDLEGNPDQKELTVRGWNRSGQLLHPRDWSPILELNPDCKVVAINVEGDVNIL